MPAIPKLEEVPPFSGHSPGEPKPLTSYGVLMSVFAAFCGGFASWFSRSGRKLPKHVRADDLALLTVATHKLSRLIAKDRVTSVVRAPFTRFQEEGGPAEVEEEARGHGLRRAIGELIICPYCLGLWIGAALTAGLLVAPRPTRWIAAVFTILTGSDVLQLAYVKAEQSI